MYLAKERQKRTANKWRCKRWREWQKKKKTREKTKKIFERKLYEQRRKKKANKENIADSFDTLLFWIFQTAKINLKLQKLKKTFACRIFFSWIVVIAFNFFFHFFFVSLSFLVPSLFNVALFKNCCFLAFSFFFVDFWFWPTTAITKI